MTQITRTLLAVEILAVSAEHEPTPGPWNWWDIPVTADTRRAAFDVDTGRLSGLSIIAEIEGLDAALEVL